MSAELKASESNSKRNWKKWDDSGAVGNRVTAILRDASFVHNPDRNLSMGEVLDDGRIIPMNEELASLLIEFMNVSHGEFSGGQKDAERESDDKELFNRLRGLTHEEQLRLIAENKAGRLYSRFILGGSEDTRPVAALGLYPRMTSRGIETDLVVINGGFEDPDLVSHFAAVAASFELPMNLKEAEAQIFSDSGFDTPEHVMDMMVGLAQRDMPSALLVIGRDLAQKSSVEFVSHTLIPTEASFGYMQQAAQNVLS